MINNLMEKDKVSISWTLKCTQWKIIKYIMNDNKVKKIKNLKEDDKVLQGR
jgi:hypothetical protein